MAGRTSLLEQKRIQWAKEREEMARLGGSWGLLKHNSNIRTTIRTYQNGARVPFAETKDRQPSSRPFRASGHYGSAVSLKSLDYNGGSLINLRDQTEVPQLRRRSPSLPPIYNKEQRQYYCQDRQGDLGVEGSQYASQKSQRFDDEQRRSYEHREDQREEREGETSGYASDSVDVPVAAERLPASCKASEMDVAERTWQNPYYATPDSSLPPSRRLSDGRIGELNRPRWGGVWGQDAAKGDPPPPSWLSRLSHSSQVLVINHDSASSPDSSTTGSTGSDTNKTYLRGQNIHVDADILQEREARRQKALELQNAIKQQLEEKDRRRQEERERRLREERLEEERIKRERDSERERFEEEQKRLKEREAAKSRQAEAMREVLEAAERLAKEQKKIRRKRNEASEESIVTTPQNCDQNVPIDNRLEQQTCSSARTEMNLNMHSVNDAKNEEIIAQEKGDENKLKERLESVERTENSPKELKPIQVPISKDVAIVLSGRLEDTEIFNKANLQLVNLVVSPSSNGFEDSSTISLGLNTLMKNMGSPLLAKSSRLSAAIVENRLLTPSKYRAANGRDFGIQTDIENDLQDLREKMQESTVKDGSLKERKDTTNASRRDVEKSTNVPPAEENSMKTMPRSKSQPRTSIDSRPRWNANRPGTRYRTQSEKDPHYQRRLRLRRRQVESSDERSRSPSPDRRKASSTKTKARNANRRKVKLDSYDADLSMDSLNSIVPLRIDKNGRINLEDSKCGQTAKARCDNDNVNDSTNIWCGQEILSKLSSLRNGLLLRQMEWDSERCLVSPAASEMF